MQSIQWYLMWTRPQQPRNIGYVFQDAFSASISTTPKKRVTEHIDKSHKSSQSPPGKLQNKVKPQLPIAKIASV